MEHEIKNIKVKCRAVILHRGKILVVRHPSEPGYTALPGGHLEYGEDIKECLKREIIEELGVEPQLGRLLYVNSFISRQKVHIIEFIFEATNGTDFVDCHLLDRSHAHELAEIIWADPEDDIEIKPQIVADDLKKENLISDQVRFFSNFK